MSCCRNRIISFLTNRARSLKGGGGGQRKNNHEVGKRYIKSCPVYEEVRLMQKKNARI